MARLLDTRSAHATLLPPTAMLGRSSSADLRLDGRSTSGQHALLRWTAGGWELRDLGSRNGTWLNGRRLAPGDRVLLARNARLGFGQDDGRYQLIDADPPVLAAVPRGGGAPALGEAGMLSLPPGQEPPELLVHRNADGGWVVERDQLTAPAPEEVEVAGQTWALVLPTDLELTWDRDAPNMSTIGLRFRVSRDEEFAQVSVLHGEREQPLEARVHHYLLLTLARQRMGDAADGLPPESAGWIHQTELARQLRIEEAQVNLQVFRARSQMAEAKIEDAAGLVERRSPGRQLRIGVPQLEVLMV